MHGEKDQGLSYVFCCELCESMRMHLLGGGCLECEACHHGVLGVRSRHDLHLK
jgi:hypothetical protein